MTKYKVKDKLLVPFEEYKVLVEIISAMKVNDIDSYELCALNPAHNNGIWISDNGHLDCGILLETDISKVLYE